MYFCKRLMLKGAVQAMLGDVFDINAVESNFTELFMILRKKVTEEIFQQMDIEHTECKECGNKMRSKGKKHRKIKGLVDYDIQVRVFYRDKCDRYEKPLDKIIGNTGQITLEVKEAMVLLGQRIPFEEAGSYIKKLLKVEISHESIQELVEGTGEKVSKEEMEIVVNEINGNGYVKDWKDGERVRLSLSLSPLSFKGTWSSRSRVAPFFLLLPASYPHSSRRLFL